MRVFLGSWKGGMEIRALGESGVGTRTDQRATTFRVAAFAWLLATDLWALTLSSVKSWICRIGPTKKHTHFLYRGNSSQAVQVLLAEVDSLF